MQDEFASSWRGASQQGDPGSSLPAQIISATLGLLLEELIATDDELAETIAAMLAE